MSTIALPRSLDALLAECKSVRTIEGEHVVKFLQEREEQMIGASALRASRLRVTGADGKTGRTYFAKDVPSGFQDKGLKVTDEQARQWAENVGLPWDQKYSGRTIPWWGSDERVDRYGDIVRQVFQFNNFKQNPVLLESHNWGSAFLMGNVINWEIGNRRSDGYNGPALQLMNLFATADMNPDADKAFRLAKAKFLRAGSIGFFPLKILIIEDPEERSKLGLGRWGVVYAESEFVEFSVCAVPALPSAVQNGIRRAAANKLLEPTDRGFVRELYRQSAGTFENPEDVRSIDRTVCELFQRLFPDLGEAPELKDLDKPIEPEDKTKVVAEPKPEVKSEPKEPEVKGPPTIEERLAALESLQDAMLDNLTQLSATLADFAASTKKSLLDLFENQRALAGVEGDPGDGHLEGIGGKKVRDPKDLLGNGDPKNKVGSEDDEEGDLANDEVPSDDEDLDLEEGVED